MLALAQRPNLLASDFFDRVRQNASRSRIVPLSSAPTLASAAPVLCKASRRLLESWGLKASVDTFRLMNFTCAWTEVSVRRGFLLSKGAAADVGGGPVERPPTAFRPNVAPRTPPL